jgi:glycosyltransferase involved in cell wall biosynthesis
MKILCHMPTLRQHTCGLSNRAVHFASALEAHGHAVTFTVREDKTDVQGDFIAGMRLEKVSITLPVSLHWSLQALRRRLAAGRLVHCLSDEHELFISCQPEVVQAYRKRHPHRLILFVCGGTTLLHDSTEAAAQASSGAPRRLAFALDRWLKRCNEAGAFEAADLCVFDSHTTRRCVVELYGANPKKCHTVYGGIDADYHRPPTTEQRASARAGLDLPADALVLAWTGRLSPEKNLGLFIRAVQRCRHLPARVFLVGDGPERARLQALCKSVNLDGVVTFVGAVPDVRPYLYAADVFVFPSVGESFGGSLAEAMACGLPCIALQGDGRHIMNASEEVFGATECGVLVSSGAPAALAAGIDHLASAPAHRRALGRLASSRARETFSWSRGGRRLCELVDGLFNERSIGEVSRAAKTSGAQVVPGAA